MPVHSNTVRAALPARVSVSDARWEPQSYGVGENADD